MYSTSVFAAFFALAAFGWATLTRGAIIVARRDVCDNYDYAIAKTGDTVWTIYDDDCDRKLVLDTDAPCDEGSFSCGTNSSASSPNITALHSTTVNNNQTHICVKAPNSGDKCGNYQVQFCCDEVEDHDDDNDGHESDNDDDDIDDN